MAARLGSLIDRAAARAGLRRPRPPVVVLGLGGSGTRAVAEVMRSAGVYLGPKLNRASDSLVLKSFLRRWSQPYVEQSRWLEAVERGEVASIAPPDPEIVADLRAALARMRNGIPSTESQWGWKNPRTTNLVPVVLAVEPEVVTAQLVRDGRDMAYSRNQHVLEDCAPALPGELREAPEPVRSIALWSRVNLANLAYIRALRGERHLVVRYEDLCEDPAAHAERLLTHLGIPFTDAVLREARELVRLSPATGRWRDAPSAEIQAVEDAGARGLAEFGYV